VTYPLYWSADIWVVAAHGDAESGISALSFTIDFDGDGSSPPLGIYTWTLCADAGTPTTGRYERPGTGYSIHWDAEANCQRTVIGSEGVHAIAGCFYVYAYSDAVFRIPTPREGTPVPFSVTDCDGNEIIPDQAAPVVGFGSAVGYNPCAEDVPVRGTTWGRLKTQY
jgi:hypothetical protein